MNNLNDKNIIAKVKGENIFCAWDKKNNEVNLYDEQGKWIQYIVLGEGFTKPEHVIQGLKQMWGDKVQKL